MCWICDHPEALFEDYVEEVLQPTIDRQGWVVQPLLGGGLLAAYTIGLTAMGLDELIVTGKPFASAYDLLEASVLQGPPLAGSRHDLLVGPALHVVPVSRCEDHLPFAVALYGRRVTARQLVWADTLGRWPWELPSSPQLLLSGRVLPRAG